MIDVSLARRLIDSQFPQWSQLPIRAVEFDGWDNRTFRLGSELSIRLPSGPWYAQQVDKEQRWLPVLAPQLPLPIPMPVAKGEPDSGFPYPWSVYRWLDGELASKARIDDLPGFATTLAGFLNALRRIDATGGPAPGQHNFYRGGPLATYEEEALQAIDTLGNEVPGDSVKRVWDDAMTTSWDREPVWVHGDVAAGEPARPRCPAGGGDRLRLVRRRRSRVRHRHRLDVPVGAQPSQAPGRASLEGAAGRGGRGPGGGEAPARALGVSGRGGARGGPRAGREPTRPRRPRPGPLGRGGAPPPGLPGSGGDRLLGIAQRQWLVEVAPDEDEGERAEDRRHSEPRGVVQQHRGRCEAGGNAVEGERCDQPAVQDADPARDRDQGAQVADLIAQDQPADRRRVADGAEAHPEQCDVEAEIAEGTQETEARPRHQLLGGTHAAGQAQQPGGDARPSRDPLARGQPRDETRERSEAHDGAESERSRQQRQPERLRCLEQAGERGEPGHAQHDHVDGAGEQEENGRALGDASQGKPLAWKIHAPTAAPPAPPAGTTAPNASCDQATRAAKRSGARWKTSWKAST